MNNMWDLATGEESPEPEPRKSRKGGWPSRQERKPHQRASKNAPASVSRTRPEEVSERDWGLAEHWMEQGTAALGKRPPKVNQAEFSKRLAAKVEADRSLQKVPGHIEEIVGRMVVIFWREIEVGQVNAPLQLIFLEDTWHTLVDRAQTWFTVDWLKQHGEDVEYKPVHRDDNSYQQLLQAQRIRDFLATANRPVAAPRTRDHSILNRFRKR